MSAAKNFFNLKLEVDRQLQPRYEEEGTFYVIPVVAAKVGVMNRAYYPESVFSIFAEIWEDTPVLAGHPKDEKGSYVSGRSRKYLNQLEIGRFRNTEYSDSKLKGEFWLSSWKSEQILGKIGLERIVNAEPMDVSIGVLAVYEEQKGVFENEEYDVTILEAYPDHVALLLNEEGACSQEKGCGTFRYNSKEKGSENMRKECSCEPKDDQKDTKGMLNSFLEALSSMVQAKEVNTTKVEVLSNEGEVQVSEPKKEVLSNEVKEAMDFLAKEKQEHIEMLSNSSKLTDEEKQELNGFSLKVLKKLVETVKREEEVKSYEGRANVQNTNTTSKLAGLSIEELVGIKGV